MKHYAAPDFWARYREVSPEVQKLADNAFKLLKAGPRHPSLHFKRINLFWSARVGLHHRALAVEITGGVLWFWIGTHAEYDKLLK